MCDSSHQMAALPPPWRPRRVDQDWEIKKPLRDFVTRLSARYIDQFDSQHRDLFSILPQELLLLIAEYVAVDNDSDYAGPYSRKMSHHLFKSRLICSAFSLAAVSAYKQIYNQPGLEHYSILRLPPLRASLQSMLLALNSASSPWKSTVKAVIWEINLQDYENKPGTTYSPPSPGEPRWSYIRAQFPDGSSQRCCRVYYARAMKQWECINLLFSNSGVKILEDVFGGLTSLDLLDVNVYSAPPEVTQCFSVKRKMDIIKDDILARIFNCLETQSSSSLHVRSIKLQRMDPRVFNQVSVSRMLRYKLNYALNDVHISFDPSQNRANFNEGSKKWNLFLSDCDNLASLTITFEPEPRPYFPRNIGKRINIHWLRGVLQNQYWPHLHRFCLKDIIVKKNVLEAFFNIHSPNLHEIVLDNIEIDPNHWVSLLNNMRDMQLKQACVLNRGGSKYWKAVDSNMDMVLCRMTRELNIRAAEKYNRSLAAIQSQTYCISDVGSYVSGETEKVFPVYIKDKYN